MNVFLIMIGGLVVLTLAGMFAEYLLEERDHRNFPPPGRCIDLPGQNLHLLQAGTACWSFYWRQVQPDIARFARVYSLGDKPLAVIQATGKPAELPRRMTQQRWREQRRAWDEIQRGLLTLSFNSRLFTADRSIHTVQIEQPEVVINAIRRVYEFRERGWTG